MFTNPILTSDAELVEISNDPDTYDKGLSCSRLRNLKHVRSNRSAAAVCNMVTHLENWSRLKSKELSAFMWLREVYRHLSDENTGPHTA